MELEVVGLSESGVTDGEADTGMIEKIVIINAVKIAKIFFFFFIDFPPVHDMINSRGDFMQLNMSLFLEYLEKKYQAKWYLLKRKNEEYEKYAKKVILNSFDEAVQCYLNNHIVDFERYHLEIVIVEFWYKDIRYKIIVEYNQKFINIECNDSEDEIIDEIFDEFKKMKW